MKKRSLYRTLFLLLAQLALILTLASPAAQAGTAPPVTAPPAVTAPDRVGTGTYTNPLHIQIPGDGLVESCADPSIIYGQQPGDTDWYIYCTTDPLNDEDRNPSGGFNFHLIPMLRSHDLVNWTYVGDVFSARPSWVAPTAGLWAPDI